MPNRLLLVAPLLAALILAGCGSGPERDSSWPKTVPVSGIVTYNGQPLEGASVTFSPTSGRHVARGTTDADGIFDLQTSFSASFEEDGAAPGDYNVLVAKYKPKDQLATQDTGDPAADMAAAYSSQDPQTFLETPYVYNDVTKTTLTANVGSEGGEFKFELVDQP